MIESMLVRYSEPTKYDHAAYGTICKCINSQSEEFVVYVQVSADDSVPEWREVGLFTEHDTQIIVDRIKNITTNCGTTNYGMSRNVIDG